MTLNEIYIQAQKEAKQKRTKLFAILEKHGDVGQAGSDKVWKAIADSARRSNDIREINDR